MSESVTFCPFCGYQSVIVGVAAGHMLEAVCSQCDLSFVVILIDSDKEEE